MKDEEGWTDESVSGVQDAVHWSKFPLPRWAEKIADGRYMVLGAQLSTRDGRKMGNAFVSEIEYNKYLNQDIAICYTDAGSRLQLTESELRSLFYLPRYIMKLEETRKKFIRR